MKEQQDSSSRRNFLKQGVVAAAAGPAALGLDGKTARAAAKTAASDNKKMPTGKIGDLEIGRLVCGSNLISMNMHARDLVYVRGSTRSRSGSAPTGSSPSCSVRKRSSSRTSTS